MILPCRVITAERKTGAEADPDRAGMDRSYTYHVLTLVGSGVRGTLELRNPLPAGVGYDTMQTITLEATL